MLRKITVISGDGLSQKLMDKVLGFLTDIKAPLNIDLFSGRPSKDKFGEILESVKKNKVALKGFWNTSLETAHESYNHAFRRDLNLWSNIVHVKSVPFISRRQDLDFVIIRQNTEGEYSQIEHESRPGHVEMYKIMTREKSEQIAKFALSYAKTFNRKKITCVHKANIMKMGDGLFLSTCREVLDKSEVEFKDMIVDNAAMQLVMKPSQFDVILLPNLYGNIMVSIGAGLVGSSGLLAGVNVNDEMAVFESATRGVANLSHSPEHLNPVSLILAYCNLLKHIDLGSEASKIEDSLTRAFKNKLKLTPDIGGTSTTDEFLESLKIEYNKK